MTLPPSTTVRIVHLPVPPQPRPAEIRLLQSCLSENEQRRLQRLRQPHDRNRYLFAHAALRCLLAHAITGAPRHPRSIAITATPQGKPMLHATNARPPLHFSLSHSGSRVLIALSTIAVGVDVQHAPPPHDDAWLRDMANDILSPAEQRQLPHIDSALLLRAWSAREALLKAEGSGLMRIAPSHIHLPASALTDWRPGAWRGLNSRNPPELHKAVFAALPADARHTAAVAVIPPERGTALRLIQHTWTAATLLHTAAQLFDMETTDDSPATNLAA